MFKSHDTTCIVHTLKLQTIIKTIHRRYKILLTNYDHRVVYEDTILYTDGNIFDNINLDYSTTFVLKKKDGKERRHEGKRDRYSMIHVQTKLDLLCLKLATLFC